MTDVLYGNGLPTALVLLLTVGCERGYSDRNLHLKTSRLLARVIDNIGRGCVDGMMEWTMP